MESKPWKYEKDIDLTNNIMEKIWVWTLFNYGILSFIVCVCVCVWFNFDMPTKQVWTFLRSDT